MGKDALRVGVSNRIHVVVLSIVFGTLRRCPTPSLIRFVGRYNDLTWKAFWKSRFTRYHVVFDATASRFRCVLLA